MLRAVLRAKYLHTNTKMCAAAAEYVKDEAGKFNFTVFSVAMCLTVDVKVAGCAGEYSCSVSVSCSK